MIGREDDRTFQLPHPLTPLHLGMGHRLREREQEAMLDQPPNRAHRFLARPSKIARRDRHDRALLRPRARAGRVPTPASSDTLDVIDDVADGAGQLHGPAVAGVPRHHWLLFCAARATGFIPVATNILVASEPSLGVSKLDLSHPGRESRGANPAASDSGLQRTTRRPLSAPMRGSRARVPLIFTRLPREGWAACACASRSGGGRRSARPFRTRPRAWWRT